jgi:SAM-dependent methyltransferase
VSGLPPVDPLAATGFARAAMEYERARPGYAAEAVAWVAERSGLGPDTTVVDVGAGTGKWTRLLAGTGARVIAVEPVAEMRELLEAVLPGVQALDGRAEDLPVADGSARLVTAAQAFHWFGEEAPPELARVLEPGGSLALVWNVRDEDDPLQARLQEIHDRERPRSEWDPEGWRRRLEDGGGFGELEERRFRHVQRLSRDDLVTRTASISFVAAATPEFRERILDEVRAVARDFPDEVELPYFTVVYLADRP